MPSLPLVIIVILFYILILFAIAFLGENLSKKKINIFNNAFIYSLSLAVYCTSWTFYGSVGLAANKGMLFLGVYLGPMLSMIIWWSPLRQLVRIKNKFKITSIVDFISARYDKSEGLGIIATLLVIFGLVPYIALQLKAIIKTIHIVSGTSEGTFANGDHIGLYVVLLMSLCTIFFGIRKLNTTERHPGMVLVLAFECFIKLAAFLAVGLFVTYVLNNGIDDILNKMPTVIDAKYSFMGSDGNTDTITWITYILLSSSAILFLPRQFHITIIENTDEKHIKTAKWLFPLYLLLINLFVLPIAIGGKLVGLDPRNADYFVLLLSQIGNNKIFSLFVFIGGFSAAAGMIMLETMTIATIITNNLFLPVFTRTKNFSWLTKYLLKIRWIAATSFILLSYFYMEIVGERNALLSMGMVSFVAVLQFAPIILGSVLWKTGSKVGAYAGLTSGSIIWFYTLVIPAIVRSGWGDISILTNGPLGISFLNPEALMGLNGYHTLTHSVFWTMLFNIGNYITFSIFFPPNESEQKIAEEFYNVIPNEFVDEIFIDESHSNISTKQKQLIFLKVLMNYFPYDEASEIIKTAFLKVKINSEENISILKLAEVYDVIEKTLSGFIGTAAAHHALKKAEIINDEENIKLSKVYGDLLAQMKINPNKLNKQIILYQEKEKLMKKETKILEDAIQRKSLELEEQKNLTFHASKMSALGEMAGGIAHEINNPLTIIGSINRIIRKSIEKGITEPSLFYKYCDDIDMTITRISKIISGLRTISRDGTNDDFAPAIITDIFNDALSICGEKFKSHGNELKIDLDEDVYQTVIDCRRVQLSQVFLNLLGNSYDAIEKLPERWIKIECAKKDNNLIIQFIDSGPGIPKNIQDKIFQPFFTTKEIGKGTGLGLSLSNSIIKSHGGVFAVDSNSPNTCFVITLPISKAIKTN